MKRYLLTDEPKADLSDIRDYLKREAGPRIAKSTLAKSKMPSYFLAAHQVGHLRDDLTDAAVKFWTVFSYLIVFDAETLPIVIIRIIHGSDIAAMNFDD